MLRESKLVLSVKIEPENTQVLFFSCFFQIFIFLKTERENKTTRHKRKSNLSVFFQDFNNRTIGNRLIKKVLDSQR